MGLPSVRRKRADIGQNATCDGSDSRPGDPRRLVNPVGFDKAGGTPKAFAVLWIPMAFTDRFAIWGAMDRIFNAVVDVRQIQNKKKPGGKSPGF
jgi:hypothetical protein